MRVHTLPVSIAAQNCLKINSGGGQKMHNHFLKLIVNYTEAFNAFGCNAPACKGWANFPVAVAMFS